jgi:hypothetical protein
MTPRRSGKGSNTTGPSNRMSADQSIIPTEGTPCFVQTGDDDSAAFGAYRYKTTSLAVLAGL